MTPREPLSHIPMVQVPSLTKQTIEKYYQIIHNVESMLSNNSIDQRVRRYSGTIVPCSILVTGLINIILSHNRTFSNPKLIKHKNLNPEQPDWETAHHLLNHRTKILYDIYGCHSPFSWAFRINHASTLLCTIRWNELQLLLAEKNTATEWGVLSRVPHFVSIPQEFSLKLEKAGLNSLVEESAHITEINYLPFLIATDPSRKVNPYLQRY